MTTLEARTFQDDLPEYNDQPMFEWAKDKVMTGVQAARLLVGKVVEFAESHPGQLAPFENQDLHSSRK